MGGEAESRSQAEAVRAVGRGVRVIPPDDDEYMAVRALDLVGKRMRCTDVLGAFATAHLDGGFVVIQYEGLPSYHRTLIRSDAWVRVKRRVGGS